MSSKKAVERASATTTATEDIAKLTKDILHVHSTATVASATTSCTTWWRLYRESQECFGLFRTVGGGIKPEAFDHCNEIPSPETRCGPYRD